MTKSKFRNSPEAKRWLIVGAYQAGASEKHVARISGLSRTAVRNIILNYQRTGTPCMPKKIPNKIRQKLIVEYDENGNIIDSDDEEEEEVVEQEVIEVPTPSPTNSSNEESSAAKDKRKESFTIKRRIIMKKKHVFKKPNNTAAARNLIKIKNQSNVVTTKDIINYAMDQMRITDNNHINISSQKLIDSPATPTPSWQNNFQQQQSIGSNYNSSSSSTNNGGKSSKLKRLPPPSKFDQNIRGYELWTHDDDMLLLNHVLHHLHGGGWNELEIRFNGRHSARLCYDRWKHLKSLLLKGITDKPNTPW